MFGQQQKKTNNQIDKKDKLVEIENILKENLMSDVHIDNAFMEAFRSELNIKAISKLSTSSKMSENSGLTRISDFLHGRAFKVAFAAVVVLAVAAVSFVMFSGSKGVTKEVKNVNPKLVAQLYVNSGKVNVLRDGNTITFDKDAELAVGDKVSVSENTIADISTYYGRLALDSSSEVTLSDKDGSLLATVENGNVFVSLSSDASNILVKTPNADVTIVSGVVFISQNGYVPATVSTGSLFAPAKAYAVEGDGSTRVACFSGASTVVAGSAQYQLEAGKEVVVTKEKTATTPTELKKDVVSTKLAQNVATTKVTENVGYLADMTAPEVTVISPVEGAVIDGSSVVVKFTSNEDGYYNFGEGWTALTAGQEVTFTKSLVAGANKIEFTVKDPSYNMKNVVVNVTANAPVYSMSWVEVPQAQSGGVYMKWGAEGAKAGQTYKVFRDGGFYKAFTVREETLGGAYWTDTATVKGKSYTYVIALYDGGSELSKNDPKSVVADTASAGGGTGSGNCSIALSRAAGQEVSWSVSGNCDLGSGWKIVWSPDTTPVYPNGNTNSQYNYLSDTSLRSGEVFDTGTLHVRVCSYHPESSPVCTNYSNEIISVF